MRISALQSDPGYETYAALRKADKNIGIRLFGVEIDNVMTADDQEGLIVKYLRDPKSKEFIRSPDGEMFVLYKLRGPVQITVR